MRNGYPSYNWYPSDWLSSEARAVMSLAEQGAYRNLLDHAWLRNPQCSLPDDDRALARLSGLDRAWPKSASIIRQQFVVRDGKLWNEKQLHVLQTALEFSERKSAAGKKGNEIKKAMHAQRPHSDPPAIAGATLPTPTPTPKELATLVPTTERPPNNGAGSKIEPKLVDDNGKELRVKPPAKPIDPAALTADQQRRFDRFWAIVHRKVGKESSIKAWRAINPDDSLTSVIIEADLAQQKWHGRDGKTAWLQDPERWLANRRWQDEPPVAQEPQSATRAASGFQG